MAKTIKYLGLATVALLLIIVSISAFAQTPLRGESSYSPVVIKESFEAIMARMKAAKPEVMKRQMDLLNERYDLSNRPAAGRDDVSWQACSGGRSRQTSSRDDLGEIWLA